MDYTYTDRRARSYFWGVLAGARACYTAFFVVTSRFRALPFLAAVVLLASCQASSHVETARADRGDVSLEPDVVTFEAVVPPNATLESLLQQQLSADLSQSVVEAVRAVFNPRELRADRQYSIVRGLDGLFREFRYDIDADNLLRVVFRRQPGAVAAEFDVAVVPVPKEYTPDAVGVELSAEHSSLIEAFDAEGENLQLPLRLAEVFGGEVDFNSDLQRGDQAEVLFDRATRAGEFLGYGDIKAAVLALGTRRLTAIRFEGADGKPSFYDEQGRSLKRQFRRSPLDFNPRVTSGFSYNRFHPVHGVARPHLGVDYGAPLGTAVYAVASGVVESAEWSGEAGRMVRIRHAGGYETAYLHLSSFGPGVRPGVRVEQSQLVGRVGQTGTATGPHLDYRVIRDGRYVNPIAEMARMPPGEPIASEQLDAFRLHRDQVLSELSTRLSLPPADGATRNTP
jgi:murein DD-endopeptidase MepM/ murein hydrolase activator NlpD